MFGLMDKKKMVILRKKKIAYYVHFVTCIQNKVDFKYPWLGNMNLGVNKLFL